MSVTTSTASTEQSIALVVSDVDQTLLTPDKELTEAAIAAVGKLRDAGKRFTITSSRPPRGVKPLMDRLKISEPVPAFNGGMVISPEGAILKQILLDPEAAGLVVKIIAAHEIEVWLYTERDWFLRTRNAPHVDREVKTTGGEPTVVESFANHLQGVAKIVAVCDDFEVMQRCEKEIHETCRKTVSASLSQKHYLDVTHPEANKGNGISFLSEYLRIPIANIATIGDGANDVAMFCNSGLSIAMGNATTEVKSNANLVTASNRENGFAKAIEEFILKRATGEMSAVLKVVLEADFHERVGFAIPASHGNVRDDQRLRLALEQLISEAHSASGLDEMAEELLLWTKIPFDNMAQVIQVLVEDGWMVVSLHDNHARLRREV